MRSFGSDNHSGVHPKIWDALALANQDHMASYGTDPISDQTLLRFQEHFGKPVDVFYVFNGTAANVVSLAGITPSYGSVLCAQCAHLENSECGAPEALGHFKLRPLAHNRGKITPQHVQSALVRRGDQHFSQAKVVSITQPTELGAVYSTQEMRELAHVAHQNGLYLHVDGARLANAAAHLGVSLKELTRDVGVDVLSFGGTKNGFLFGEAVVVFRSDLHEHYKYLRKQMMQLPSKTRFIAAQFDAYLQHNLWREIANHSNNMAMLLAERLASFDEIQITHPVQSNTVFAKIPKGYISALREKYFFYVWDEHTFEVRLVTSFDTTHDDVEGFITHLSSVRARKRS